MAGGEALAAAIAAAIAHTLVRFVRARWHRHRHKHDPSNDD